MYWAISISRALRVPLYRRQAFGVGFLVFAIWAVVAAFVLLGAIVSSPWEVFELFVAYYFRFIVLFYWIDASILASRRSDPLLRDTLYWSKVRIILWIAIVVTTLIPMAILGYTLLTSNNALFEQMTNGTLGGPVISNLLDGIVLNFPIVIPIVGLIYLPAISLRSKWDRSLRRHFIWFAPASLGVLLLFFGIPMPQSVGQFVSPLLLVVMGYSLYRSAKALVPLNRVVL